MKSSGPFPAAWGRTGVAWLYPPGTDDSTGERRTSWELDDAPRVSLDADGPVASGPPDTVAVCIWNGSGDVVAICDALDIQAIDAASAEREPYLVLRVRDVLDPARWRFLPWSDLRAGHVVHAIDKHTAARTLRASGPGQTDPDEGIDWATLEVICDRMYPVGAAPPRQRPAATRPGDAELLAAVRDNDLERVCRLIARGANANAGVSRDVASIVPGVSRPHSPTILQESVQLASPEITEALLAAGAEVDWRARRGPTALHAAILGRRLAHVPVLLKYGADPLAEHDGATAIELAERADPNLAAALRRAVRES